MMRVVGKNQNGTLLALSDWQRVEGCAVCDLSKLFVESVQCQSSSKCGSESSIFLLFFSYFNRAFSSINVSSILTISNLNLLLPHKISHISHTKKIYSNRYDTFIYKV